MALGISSKELFFSSNNNSFSIFGNMVLSLTLFKDLSNIHYKVADCLGYEIQAENGEVVLSAEDGYVPETLAPKERGYGDYIIMDIDENGQIANWEFNFSDFESSED